MVLLLLPAIVIGTATALEGHDPFCSACHTEPEAEYVLRSLSEPSDLASAHTSAEVRCIDCHSGEGLFGRSVSLRQGAGDVARAVEQYMAAGGRARRLYANHEALGHFDHALELAGERNDEMTGERGAVLLELFRGEAAVEDYEWLLESARGEGDRPAELEALLGLGRGYYIISLDHPETGAAESSLKHYDEAHELAVELSDKTGVIRSRVPTIWFTDFWPEYEQQARVNAEQAYEASRSMTNRCGLRPIWRCFTQISLPNARREGVYC